MVSLNTWIVVENSEWEMVGTIAAISRERADDKPPARRLGT
jgi:hypothetical protein